MLIPSKCEQVIATLSTIVWQRAAKGLVSGTSPQRTCVETRYRRDLSWNINVYGWKQTTQKFNALKDIDYLQDFNMVKIQSRPQTTTIRNGYLCWKTGKDLLTVCVVGSESYSGTKIRWTERSVWVRIPPRLQSMCLSGLKSGSAKPVCESKPWVRIPPCSHVSVVKLLTYWAATPGPQVRILPGTQKKT